MTSKNYFFITLGVLIGIVVTFLHSDIHFYMIRGSVAVIIAGLVGFSTVFLFATAKK